MTPDEFVARCCGVRCLRPGEWMVWCPAHDDQTPSLHVTAGRRAILLYDFGAQCTLQAITAPLGLRVCDLFSDEESPPWRL